MVRYSDVTAPQVFIKHPDEVWTEDAQREMDFTKVLGNATIDDVESISSEAVSNEDTTGDGAPLVADNENASGDSVLYDVAGGYEDTDYVITITVNLVGGGQLTGVQRLECRSK